MFETNRVSRKYFKERSVSVEKSESMRIAAELSSISIALSVIALNQSGAEAANAEERKRYDDATQKCVTLLLQRIEKL